MLANRDPKMRLSAIWAIGELRFHGGRALLEQREQLENKPDVRARLRQALAEYGTEPEVVK